MAGSGTSMRGRRSLGCLLVDVLKPLAFLPLPVDPTHPAHKILSDFWTGTTGNIAVEFASRGKPSGISKTKSDYYAFILAEQFRDEVIIFIKTKRLKEIAREYYLKGAVKEMGDDKTSLSVLIPIKELSKFAYNDRATDSVKENKRA